MMKKKSMVIKKNRLMNDIEVEVSENEITNGIANKKVKRKFQGKLIFFDFSCFYKISSLFDMV